MTIKFTLKEPVSQLQLQVYDERGIIVHQQQIPNAHKGNQTFTWKAVAVANGVYAIRVTDQQGKILLQQRAAKMDK